MPYLGEGLSLLSAVLWALAIVFFRKSGRRVHPLSLNMFKNLLAFTLFIPTVYLFGETLLRPAPVQVYLLLVLSGIIGIAIGDTLLFGSLNNLGASLSAIVICLYSPFIIALSLIFLQESLTMLQVLGAAMIICAVLIATMQKEKQTEDSKKRVVGIVLGVLASASMAVGVIIMKPILETSPLVWTTLVRLCGGIIGLAVVFLIYPRRRALIDSLITTRSWTYTITGSLIGAYAAMLIWLGGMKYTQASVASALNQTSTIFIFVFAALLLKERMNLRKTIGVVLAFAGSILVTFF
jgi:drug/metabolite transporter (DMT)-like permease